MATIYSFQVSTETTSLQPVTPKRNVVRRAYTPHWLKRSALDLIIKGERTVREVQLRTGLTEKQILDVLLEWAKDEADKAARKAWIAAHSSGPKPPATSLWRLAA